MSYEKRFRAAYLELQQVCREAGWGDPFSYARGKEMFMAIELGHSVADTLSGADAFNQNGEPVEYKSTIGKSISGTYNGISVLSSWEEQVEYLQNKKIGCYGEHYIARFGRESGVIEEMYQLTGEQACEILIPKLAKKYPTQLTKKDPRLGATITKAEIYKYGTRIV